VTDTEAAPLTVDIVSDVMCPWCYIGKRRFEKALAMKPDVKVDVRWRPFQLDPTIPAGGMDRKQYLENKFGGADKAQHIYAAVSEAGANEAIPFAYDSIKVSPNTLNAHRLIRWAVSPGLQDEIVERLFSLYFIEGADVGDPDVLLSAAEAVGLDREIISDLINSDADLDLVRQEVALAQQLGISGVPCFIVNNRYAVMGAERPEVIVNAFERAQSDTTPVPPGQAPYS
jgi:predicted DsbA family dithiol-disulfide isomerase